MEKNRPCYDKRIGSIRVAIWENTSESNGTPKKWHNVSIIRRYKDGNDWKESPTLNGLGDLAQPPSPYNWRLSGSASGRKANPTTTKRANRST